MKFSSVSFSEDSRARTYQICGQILTFSEKKDLMHNMVTTSNRISCMSMHWATTTNQPNQTERKNTMHDGTSQSHAQESLFPIHHSKGGSSQLDHHNHRPQPLFCLSRPIGHLTRLPRLTRPNWLPRPTQSRRRLRSRRRPL